MKYMQKLVSKVSKRCYKAKRAIMRERLLVFRQNFFIGCETLILHGRMKVSTKLN